MKRYLLIVLTLSQSLFSASLEHITINNHDFSVVTEQYEFYDSKGEVMKLYKEERNKNLSFALRLTLKDTTGGCSSKSIEEGAYDINGSVITLYTQWKRRGKAYDAPAGVRVQRFEVQNDGTLEQVFGELYIETARKRYAEDSGLKYLFTPAKTKEEKDEFTAYIKEVERMYKGTFVFGAKKKELKKEVKEALTKSFKASWQKRASS